MQKSLWNYLAETDKPIFLYGTGNGGDKIISALEKYDTRLTGIFASDGFVRDRYFHEYKVRAYSDVCEEYGDDIIVLLAFGTTLPEVIRFIEGLAARHELYIPDVPLYGGELFDSAYHTAHLDDLNTAESLLYDEYSKKLFHDAVMFKLTGKPEYLNRTDSWECSLKELFSDRIIGTVIDGGAFKGDSTQLFAEVLNPESIIAVEADPRTFKKLQAYAVTETRCKVHPVHAALCDCDGELEYISSGSRGSALDGQNHRAKTTFIPCCTIDALCESKKADVIKLDIEGAEDKALDGAEKTILRDQPDLMISLYHRTEDFYALILRIHSLLPDHRLFLRRIPCIPMWDLTLYAIK